MHHLWVSAGLALLVVVSCQFRDHIQDGVDVCIGEDVFQCHHSGCIPLELYCDGKPDCNDHSDENFCPNYRTNISLCNSSHEWTCADASKCIPYSWICNNENECKDGSDEKQCASPAYPPENDTCHGFKCKDGMCISRLWVCDGSIDCKDASDEFNDTLCRYHKDYERLLESGGHSCDPLDFLSHQQYKCPDETFCLTPDRMCDGLYDCKDRSDEGRFCEHWATMCTNLTCAANATCRPNTSGPYCECRSVHYKYNEETNSCTDRDECVEARSHCAQTCTNTDGGYICSCDEGYITSGSMCFLADKKSDVLLFFSHRYEIRYIKPRGNKTKYEQTVAISGLKKAHGVSFDGQHIYWAEAGEGHQAIVRAKFPTETGDITKETLVGLGLEEPGDIAIDWLAGHFYFSDAGRQHIAACVLDGAVCTILNTTTNRPRFVTLHPQAGQMYWSDFRNRSVIMRANMDGSEPTVFIDYMVGFPTGLAVDAPGQRLYYTDRGLRAARLDGRGSVTLLSSDLHHPFSITVFESAVYFTDWASNSIKATNKIIPAARKVTFVRDLNAPVFGIHMYHPVLQPSHPNPCENNKCSDMCLLRGEGHACACAQDRALVDKHTCAPASFRRLPQFLIIGGGSYFTRIRYNALGNAESRAVRFDVGKVTAMAYNNFKRILYVYDSHRKSINYIQMNDFSKGITKLLIYKNLEDVVDMDYDYVTDSLYILDAHRQFLEAYSIRTNSRAIVHRFRGEVPLSMTVTPEYGRAMVATRVEGPRGDIHISTIGLNGQDLKKVMESGFVGPRVSLRFAHEDMRVYITDEGSGVIYTVHPSGSGKEVYRSVSTKVTSIAASDTTVFWTDKHAPRLFWAYIHDSSPRVRRIDLTMFPNHTQLYLQSTIPFPNLDNPLMHHPCFRAPPCSHVCTQNPHLNPELVPMSHYMGYTCLCPPGQIAVKNKCEVPKVCEKDEVLCYIDNSCAKGAFCDGKHDCVDGGDEDNCDVKPASNCTEDEFQCISDRVCIARYKLCDGTDDCSDNSDERGEVCHRHQCRADEMRCLSGACVVLQWKCDGNDDCPDGSDELDCEPKVCTGPTWQCFNGDCIDFYRKCDGVQDCLDFSDEDMCDDDDDDEMEDVICEDDEYTCLLNRSICLPYSARCDGHVDCPDGTDEADCTVACPAWTVACSDDLRQCVPLRRVCDGTKDCSDGSDEPPKRDCPGMKTNKTPLIVPTSSCPHGFRCGTGECLEMNEVCDNTMHCLDGSDEKGLCAIACVNHTCSHTCQATPTGAKCTCPVGYTVAETTCLDIDECEGEPCAQQCNNTIGSFECSCFIGYDLRPDGVSCKASAGEAPLRILHPGGNTIEDGAGGAYCHERLSDIDIDVRRNFLYGINKNKQLVMAPRGDVPITTVSNIGTVNKVAVEWVTGTVYAATTVRLKPRVVACSVHKRRCAVLHKLQHTLPEGAEIQELAVDPSNFRLFYARYTKQSSSIFRATLTGDDHVQVVALKRNCTGLALDTNKKKMYVAQSEPAVILQIDYDGINIKILVAHDIHLRRPYHLILFEDHLYFLIRDSYHLNECSVFQRVCRPFAYRLFENNTYAIDHPNVQRQDVVNVCEGFECNSVCVLSEVGPVCVCADGKISEDGATCALLDEKEMAVFSGGWPASLGRSSSGAVLAAFLAFMMSLAAVGLFYFVKATIRKYRDREAPVRFLNTSPPPESATTSAGTAEHPEPIVQLGTVDLESSGEFVNPLRRVLRGSFFRRTRRPVGTAALQVNVPQPLATATGSSSSTESSDADTKTFL